jgi:hypothetical protein
MCQFSTISSLLRQFPSHIFVAQYVERSPSLYLGDFLLQPHEQFQKDKDNCRATFQCAHKLNPAKLPARTKQDDECRGFVKIVYLLVHFYAKRHCPDGTEGKWVQSNPIVFDSHTVAHFLCVFEEI